MHSLDNQSGSAPSPHIVVVIPCYNEEKTIATVVQDFQMSLPEANIYVYDNNSSDQTAAKAKEAGAIVRNESLQGKGHVIRRMFSDIDADIYLMVDGDDTYDASAAPLLVEALINNSLDMVNGKRVDQIKAAYRPGHRFGNWLLTSIVTTFFGERTKDMLSGYRAFSRRFIKSFPALSMGFEIETELTVHALGLQMPITDVEIRYKDRPEGSESKLNTIQDGIRILKTIGLLIKEERPLEFFSAISLFLGIISILTGYPIITEYFDTGLVPRFPSAILASAIMILAFLSFFSGVILSTVSNGRKEMRRLIYLQHNGVESFRQE
jgi:glycosyltransferase involved in cell wall biosynthesis